MWHNPNIKLTAFLSLSNQNITLSAITTHCKTPPLLGVIKM